jgi:hypothetical protein
MDRRLYQKLADMLLFLFLLCQVKSVDYEKLFLEDLQSLQQINVRKDQV